MNPQPRPVTLPEPEVVMDGLPARQVVRQRAPSAAHSDEVLDAVDDLSQGVAAMPAARLPRRQQRLRNLPPAVAQVARVWPTRRRLPSERKFAAGCTLGSRSMEATSPCDERGPL